MQQYRTIQVKIECGEILCGRCRFCKRSPSHFDVECVLYGVKLNRAEPIQRCERCLEADSADGQVCCG